jgi:hypothetical protein
MKPFYCVGTKPVLIPSDTPKAGKPFLAFGSVSTFDQCRSTLPELA